MSSSYIEALYKPFIWITQGKIPIKQNHTQSKKETNADKSSCWQNDVDNENIFCEKKTKKKQFGCNNRNLLTFPLE